MINFKSENTGEWFYFDEDNHDEGGVCLRELSSDQLDNIEKITVKIKKKVKRGVAFDDVTTDEKLANKMRWDYCIVDWKGINLDGEELECNRENKVKIMKVLDFLKFVGDCLEKLTDVNQTLKEAQLKNSGDTSSGSTEE